MAVALSRACRRELLFVFKSTHSKRILHAISLTTEPSSRAQHLHLWKWLHFLIFFLSLSRNFNASLVRIRKRQIVSEA